MMMDHDHNLNMVGHDQDYDLNMMSHEDIPALQEDFRAAVIQVITDAGDDPEHPEIRPQIEMLEHEYANHLEQTGIYISGKNDIPGFRKVVFLGSRLPYIDMDEDTDEDKWTEFTGWLGVIAVTSDGRLVTGIVADKNRNTRKPVTIIQAIKVLVGQNQSRQEFIIKCLDFYLDENMGRIKGLWEINSCVDRLLNITSCIDLYTFKYGAEVKIKRFLFQQTHDRLASMRSAILGALDENILCDLRKNNSIKISNGRWLTGGDGAAEDVVMARQQAARAYPILAEIFQERWMFRNVIDTRASLSKAIADCFQVDEHRVKRLSGLTWQHVGFDWKNSLITAKNMISDFLHLPDKYFPKTLIQFQHLEILREFGQTVYNEGLIKFTERLSKNSDPWKLTARMEQTSARSVIDAIIFLNRKLLVPAMVANCKYIEDEQIREQNWIHEKAGLDAIRKHFSVRELLDWSDRYHRNIARYEDRLDIISVNRDWPGILGTIDLGNGCRARELTSSVALKTQGRAENHCVGGYVSQILNKKEHSRDRAVMIFSLEQNGEILGTIEIICSMAYSGKSPKPDDFGKPPKPDDSGKPLKSDDFGQEEKYLQVQVGQNHARDNTKPSRMARTLAERVAARLQQAGTKVFQTYLDGLHEARTEQDRISGIASHVIECGFDPRNRAHFEKVWDELALALPQWFRRNGLDALIKHGLSRENLKKPSAGMETSHQTNIIHTEGQQKMHPERNPEHDGP